MRWKFSPWSFSSQSFSSNHSNNVSSRRVGKSGGGRGGGPNVLKQAVSNRRRPRAQKVCPRWPKALGQRNARIWLVANSDYVILDSNWLTKF